MEVGTDIDAWRTLLPPHMKIASADPTPEFNFLPESIIFENLNSVHRKHGRLVAWVNRICGASIATISDSPAQTQRGDLA